MKGFLWIIHGGALAVIPFLTLPCGVAEGIALVIAVNFVITWYAQVTNAVTHLDRNEAGRWTLIYAQGAVYQAERLPNSFVHPHLIIITFRVAGGCFLFNRKSVILPYDSLDSLQLRRLRVLLLNLDKNDNADFK